ncbi:MAG: hypothetical protein RJB64_1998, partial [Pseudomonadota bacterium]
MRFLITAVLAIGLSSGVHADFPSKPVKIVVSSAPG